MDEVKKFLEQLLPKWKITFLEPSFIKFERNRCTYTMNFDRVDVIPSKVLIEAAKNVIDHYGKHLLDYQEKDFKK